MLTTFASARRIGLIATASAILTVGNASGAEPLHAGVARVNLTPPLEMKAALGGYGARLSQPATGVHDSVWAKALVLSQDGRKFAVVTADVLAFPPGFKGAVIERLATNGWSAAQVLLLASHSHTSIDMMALHRGNEFNIPQVGLFHRALFERTADLLAKVIREASKDHVPISVASATVSVPNRNRNRRHAGTVHDQDLTVTRIDTAQGRPLAALVNWTAHPTFMDAEDMLFSGDWPGHLQRTMEALIGRGVTVMFYNGAEGDQSPVPPPEAGSNWERAERYGREMGITAWRTWEKIHPQSIAVLACHTEPIALPRRQSHPEFMKTGGAEYGLNEAMMNGFLTRLVPEQTHSTCLRLGNLLLLGVPGEMAAQLGLEAKAAVKQRFKTDCVTIGGLADEWVSYILPAEQYVSGGYEASMSFYGESLGRTVVEGVIRSATALSTR